MMRISWKKINFFVAFIVTLQGCSEISNVRQARAWIRKTESAHGSRAQFYSMRNVCFHLQVQGQPSSPRVFDFYKEPQELPEKRDYYLFALPFKLRDEKNAPRFEGMREKRGRSYAVIALATGETTHRLYIDPRTHLVSMMTVASDPTLPHEKGPLDIEFSYEAISGLKIATRRTVYRGEKKIQEERLSNVVFWCRS